MTPTEESNESPPNTASTTDSGNNDGSQRDTNSNTDNNNGGGNNLRQQHNRNNRNSGHGRSSFNHSKEWKGDCEDLALVLGIKPERLPHQTSVDGLLEKLESYVKHHFDFSEDVICFFANEDPIEKSIDKYSNHN